MIKIDGKQYFLVVLYACIVCLYLWLLKPTWEYLYRGFVINHDLFFIITLSIIVLVIKKTARHQVIAQFTIPTIDLPRGFLLCIVSTIYLLLEVYIKINILSATVALSGMFILYTFVVSKHAWKDAILPFLLLAMSLPFGKQLDIYIGYPLRMGAAELITEQLKIMGLQPMSVHTILVIENRASQIDIDCSGIKGLWTGLIFLLTYTWLFKIKINLKWIGVMLLMCATLILFNFLRISMLIIFNSFEWHRASNWTHHTISFIGITFACVLTHLFLNKDINQTTNVGALNITATKTYLSPYWSMMVFGYMLLINTAYTPTKNIAATTLPMLMQDSCFSMQPLPLSQQEKFFFERDGSEYLKFKFNFSSISGEAIIVKSIDWRGQHKPEICFEASGFQLNSIKTVLVDTDFPIKILTFNNTKSFVVSWFQSPTMITDDYALRNWQEITGKENRWILSSIVINNISDHNDLKALLFFIKNNIKQFT